MVPHLLIFSWLYCRFQKMDMHRASFDSSIGLKRNYKGKMVLHPTLVREYPTMVFHEDNEMHFSFAPNAMAIEWTTKYDHDVEVRQEEAEGHDDAQYTDVDLGQVHIN